MIRDYLGRGWSFPPDFGRAPAGVTMLEEEADIVSIVGEFVKLKRVGNSYRGPCPFHHG